MTPVSLPLSSPSIIEGHSVGQAGVSLGEAMLAVLITSLLPMGLSIFSKEFGISLQPSWRGEVNKEKKISKISAASSTLATRITLTGLSSHTQKGFHRYFCFWDTAMGSKCPTKATDSVASLAELSCKWEKQNFPLPHQRFTKLLRKIWNARGSSSLMLTHRYRYYTTWSFPCCPQ